MLDLVLSVAWSFGVQGGGGGVAHCLSFYLLPGHTTTFQPLDTHYYICQAFEISTISFVTLQKHSIECCIVVYFLN